MTGGARHIHRVRRGSDKKEKVAKRRGPKPDHNGVLHRKAFRRRRPEEDRASV
jgi:hypothetical protein